MITTGNLPDKLRTLAAMCTAVLLLQHAAPAQMAVSCTTNTYEGQLAPECPAVIWIQTVAGAFIRTINIWCNSWWYPQLPVWSAVSLNDPDGITAATRTAHGPLSAAWDLTGQDDARVADGTYEFWVEYTEDFGINNTSKTAHGSIAIDNVGKEVEATGSEYIFGLKAIYVPMSAATDMMLRNGGRSPSIAARIATHGRNLIVSINPSVVLPADLGIFDSRGNKVLSARASARTSLVAVSGRPLMPGTYVCAIDSRAAPESGRRTVPLTIVK
jgi:hypothetical protein